MNKFLYFFLLFCAHLNAQKQIYIMDSVSHEFIKDAQIIVNEEVYYTNDDGTVILPNTNSFIKISSYSYHHKIAHSIEDTIFLHPKYNEIEIIENINRKTFFILKNLGFERYENMLNSFNKLFS